MAKRIESGRAPLSGSLNSPLKRASGVALIAFVLLCLFDLKVLSSHDWDPKAFILERESGRPITQDWDIGYDAQWYYAIALDPFGAGPRLDQPAYRYQRIVFPLLTRALSFGQPQLVPWAMMLLNLIASALACGILAYLLQRRGVSPYIALILPLSVGYLFAIRVDLLEPLALALALSGWLAYELEKRTLAIALFALGGLTKEFVLAFPAALIVWEAMRIEPKRAAALALGTAGPYLGWALFLLIVFGTTEKGIAQRFPILLPFSGLRYLTDPPSRLLVVLWVLLPAIVGGVLAILTVRRYPTEDRGRDALLILANVALIAFMPRLTWIDPLAVLRVGLGLLSALLIGFASSYPRALPYSAALWTPSGLILALMPGLL